MAWTSPRTYVAGELITAAIMNSAVRDNLAYLKASPTFDGNVLVTGTLGVTGAITGTLTGNASTATTAVTVTGATQTAITSAVNLVTVGTITTGVWNAGLINGQTINSAANLTGTLAVAGAVTGGTYNGQTISNAATFTGTLAVATALSIGTTPALSGILRLPNNQYLYGRNAADTDQYQITGIDTSNRVVLGGSGGGVVIPEVVTVTGFGVHTISSGAVGINWLVLENTNSSTTSRAILNVKSGTADGYIQAVSQGYTPAGSLTANSMHIEVGSAGGLDIVASHANGDQRFWTGGSNKRGTMFASGGFSWGDATDPGATNFRVAGTVIAADQALGTGAFSGNKIQIGRNASGSGAAGALGLQARGATYYYVWADNTGVVRVNATDAPTENGAIADTAGTVVGTQTSSLDTKDLLGDDLAPADALAAILRAPVKRFRYKSGAYNDTIFHGVIADDSPEFAMDPDAAHPNGRSLNPVNALGYTIQAVKALEARIAQLEQRH